MAEVGQEILQELQKEMEELQVALNGFLLGVVLKHTRRKQMKTLSQKLFEDALNNCEDEAAGQWLRENSESFSQLADMFLFLKKHIDEEEKKNHSNNVDITFLAHGAIRLPMIPSCSLLPLSSITDVVLYSPWNCVSTAHVVYSVTTGKIMPQHRVFSCDQRNGCKISDENHQPTNLPNRWNSMRKAAGWKIPTIMVSPLKAKDGVWERYELLTKTHGSPGRNRIIIPFTLEENTSQSFPFSVVTLALSLVLLKSRFKATVHLTACLSDQASELRHYGNYLQQQYACVTDNTVMTVSDNMYSGTWAGLFKRWFG